MDNRPRKMLQVFEPLSSNVDLDASRSLREQLEACHILVASKPCSLVKELF